MLRSFGNTEFLRALSATEGWTTCERIVSAFEDAWRSESPPAIETYLIGEGSIRRALLLELVHTDLELRIRSGDEVSESGYLRSFPELAEDDEAVRELFATAADLRRRYTSPRSTRLLRPAQPTSPLPEGESALPQVPGYEIVGQIGRGGMGVVYKAIEKSLGRPVALKFLPDDYIRDADRLARFRHEARTASALNHPHICTVHALGEYQGRPFIVLEFVDGETLHSVLRERPQLDDVTRWIVQAARALAAAHAAGVVHRDVKPENLMVRNDGYLKVVDFGLARALPSSLIAGSTPETDPKTILGTIRYLSPEQTRGQGAESASDVFALGVVFYQLLTGVYPFEAESPVLTLAAIAAHEPMPPSRLNAGVPEFFDGLVAGMLRKQPELRTTALEIDAALSSWRRSGVAVAGRANARPVILRQRELNVLRGSLGAAEAGRGSMVCLSGEPGIGKSTLVEEFLAELALSDYPPLVARGHCSERMADTEVYLPVLEALENLLRREGDSRLSQIMRAVAPSWLAHLSPVVGRSTAPSHDNAPSHEGRAASQNALLREFGKLLEEISRQRPLVLYFDDVHWADLSTVDLLAHIGRQCSQLRLLIVLTYRPTELQLSRHPLQQALLELQSRGVCHELPLEFLQRDDVSRYLALAFPDHEFPAALANEVFSRTEGSPLFMVDLLSYLVSRSVIAQVDGRWRLVQELPDLVADLPASVRSMIGRKLDRLSSDDRRIIAAASAQGFEFCSAIVASALECDPLVVEERLQQLDRVHGLVRFVGEEEFPDRTLTARYLFVHALYQQALYHDLSPSRRAALSLNMARHLEQHFGQRRTTVAAQLVHLYETGRDPLRAAECLKLSAQNAAQVFAHQEAANLARRGLRLLKALPESVERNAVELGLQTLLGLQLQVLQGYGAPEARQAYNRALALCSSDAVEERFPVLWGLWLCHKVASNLQRAQTLAEELSALARAQRNQALVLQSHQALGMTAFCRGQLSVSMQNVEQAVTLYDPRLHREHASSFGQDPSVMCRAFGSIVLWLLGYPDSAKQQSQATLQMCESMSPTTQAVAWHFAAMLQQLLRDPAQTRRCAERSTAISTEHGLSFWQAGGEVLIGWATAQQGARSEGIARLRAGLQKWRATGSVTYETYYLGLLAELLIADGQLEAAASAIDDALLLARRSGEDFYAADLHRLRAQALHASGVDTAQIERVLESSLELARSQGARSAELRSLLTLAKVHPSPGTRGQLAAALAGFSEGRDSKDLRDAAELASS